MLHATAFEGNKRNQSYLAQKHITKATYERFVGAGRLEGWCAHVDEDGAHEQPLKVQNVAAKQVIEKMRKCGAKIQ